MSSVAEQLRAGREAKKLTIHQIAEITKIRTDHVRAIEEGNYDVFSAPVYIRGFIRSYATVLKLDVKRLMSELDTELGQSEKFREPPPLLEPPNTTLDFISRHLSQLNWRIAAAVGGAFVLVLIVVLMAGRSRGRETVDPLVGQPAAVYQPRHSGETLPLPAPSRRP